jgi:4-amino-4-deoxy-L-arabinose transferase-like glycosyltransferase
VSAPDAAAADPAGREVAQAGAWHVLALVAALFLLWSILPALVQTAPHGDNVEQLNWSHSLQWGYIKHPPLSTWLLHAALTLFAPSDYLGYALGMACVAACLALVWRCAHAFSGDAAFAWLAVLLTSADYYLMGRGSFFNHNTVMLPFVAASAWAVLRIVRGGAGGGTWLLLGLAQALGMLTKYQMAVIILANALALLSSGVHRQPGFLRNAALASGATVLPLFPHALWLPAHGYSSFEYAGHSLLADLGPFDRARQALGFLAQQVGRLAPMIVALGLAWGGWKWIATRPASFSFSRGREKGDNACPGRPDRPSPAKREKGGIEGRALLVLALVPLAAILVMTLALGVAPQNHWGSTTTLMLPLLAAVHLSGRPWFQPRFVLPAVVTVQVLAAAWVAVAAAAHPEIHNRFAAAELAREADLAWRARSSGAIRLVVGPDWEAGALALHLPGFPLVMAGGRPEQAPWVSPALVARCGALLVWRDSEPQASQITADWISRARDAGKISFTDARGFTSSMDIAVVLPVRPGECGDVR